MIGCADTLCHNEDWAALIGHAKETLSFRGCDGQRSTEGIRNQHRDASNRHGSKSSKVHAATNSLVANSKRHVRDGHKRQKKRKRKKVTGKEVCQHKHQFQRQPPEKGQQIQQQQHMQLPRSPPPLHQAINPSTPRKWRDERKHRYFE